MGITVKLSDLASYQVETPRQLSTRYAYARRKTVAGQGYRQEEILLQTQYNEDIYTTGSGYQDQKPYEDTGPHQRHSHSVRTGSEYEGRPELTTLSPHNVGKLAENYTREAGYVSTGSNAYKCIRREKLFTSVLS